MNAYILCGGQSKRMGTNKIFVPIQGLPMAEYMYQKLHLAGFTNIYAVVKTKCSINIPQLVETNRDFHPLYGVSSALEHTTSRFSLITPCDVPFVSQSTLKNLHAKREFVTVCSSEIQQPLLGVFPKALATKAHNYAEQSLSVMNFVSTSQRLLVSTFELTNINTPQNLKENL